MYIIEHIISKTNKDNLIILYFCEEQDNAAINIKILKRRFKNLKFIKGYDNKDKIVCYPNQWFGP